MYLEGGRCKFSKSMKPHAEQSLAPSSSSKSSSCSTKRHVPSFPFGVPSISCSRSERTVHSPYSFCRTCPLVKKIFNIDLVMGEKDNFWPSKKGDDLRRCDQRTSLEHSLTLVSDPRGWVESPDQPKCCVCAEPPLRMTQDPHQINDPNTPLRSLANVSEWSKGVRPSPPARTLLLKICRVLSVYHCLAPKKVMIYFLRSLANVSEWSKGVRPSPPARTLLVKICLVLSVYRFLPPKKVMIYFLRSLANVSEWSKGVRPSPPARTLPLKICWVLWVYHFFRPKR